MSFENILESSLSDLDDVIQEVTAIRKKSVRRGRVVKRRDCPKNYRLVGGKRCVRMKSKERITRKRAGRKAARRGKAARKRQFKRSIRMRQRRKLKTKRFR